MCLSVSAAVAIITLSLPPMQRGSVTKPWLTKLYEANAKYKPNAWMELECTENTTNVP